MTLVGIFGLFGNILGLIILTRPQMRRLPINLILIGKLKVINLREYVSFLKVAISKSFLLWL